MFWLNSKTELRASQHWIEAPLAYSPTPTLKHLVSRRSNLAPKNLSEEAYATV